ncbi:MAG TPA: c-type cytochrome [Gemmatimonadaceae bacterium]|nr:c-type cytochrome [Gemmatimonadaceae bacterium]
MSASVTRRLSPVLVLTALVLTSCKREERRFREEPPASNPSSTTTLSTLQPGPTVREVKTHGPYQQNAYMVNEGKALFNQMNCVGCHANGGGGMGPPLMDDEWIYGSDPQQIFSSIAQGRPNGMPAWAAVLSSDQIWRLVGYVQSMSGQLRKDIAPTRSDDMFGGPSEQRATAMKPKNQAPPPSR